MHRTEIPAQRRAPVVRDELHPLEPEVIEQPRMVTSAVAKTATSMGAGFS
jgi:hypothetical protein